MINAAEIGGKRALMFTIIRASLYPYRNHTTASDPCKYGVRT
jgi:hypothetical protein